MVSIKFDPKEVRVVLEQTQAMHASVKAFMKIYFSSYLHSGELDLIGLHELCCDSDREDS